FTLKMPWFLELTTFSTFTTLFRSASKRAGVSAVNQPRTSPSIEMPLSSQKQLSLPSPSVPASEQASWEIPSIRQPSPRNTQVKRSEEHTSELQSRENLVCRLLLEK